MSVNVVVISGNITREPEMRETSSGSCVLNFGVAVNDRVKNQTTGEWEDRPNFFDCVLFGKRAESLSRFLHKGTMVTVQGRLRWGTWEKDGQKRSKVDIVAEELTFSNRDQQPATQSVGGVSLPAGTSVEAVYDDEDIPF